MNDISGQFTQMMGEKCIYPLALNSSLGNCLPLTLSSLHFGVVHAWTPNGGQGTSRPTVCRDAQGRRGERTVQV